MTGAVSRPNTKCHRLIWSVPALPLVSLPLEAVTAVSVRAFSSTEVAVAVESPTASSFPTAGAWAGVAGSAEGKRRWNRRGSMRGRGMRRGKITRMSVRVNRILAGIHSTLCPRLQSPFACSAEREAAAQTLKIGDLLTTKNTMIVTTLRASIPLSTISRFSKCTALLANLLATTPAPLTAAEPPMAGIVVLLARGMLGRAVYGVERAARRYSARLCGMSDRRLILLSVSGRGICI